MIRKRTASPQIGRNHGLKQRTKITQARKRTLRLRASRRPLSQASPPPSWRIVVHSLHGRKSLSRRLPLLISGLLLAALAAFAFAGYHQLTSALTAAAKNRVQSATHLLAKTFETSIPQLRADLNRTASDSAVQRLVRTNDASTRKAAELLLAERVAKNPQVIGLELRGKDGKRLLWVDGPAAAKAARLRDTHVESSPPKGLLVGPIVADRGTLFYEVGIPITSAASDTIGTLAEFRQVSSAQGAQLLGGLIGSDATLLFGNRAGLWTNLATVVAGPPVVSKGSPVVSYTAPDGSERLGSMAPVNLTPWLVWVDIRMSAILAPARRFLRDMALAGLLILIVGAVGGVADQPTDYSAT